MTTTVDHEKPRKHLLDAIYITKNEHYRIIDKECHIAPVMPESLNQFIEWMENKKYKINEDIDLNEPIRYISDIIHMIDFRPNDPDYKRRTASYKKMDEDYEALKLRINVLDPEKMIKEVEDFKKKTYH